MTELDVLQCFGPGALDLSAGEIIRMSSIPRSTAFRFLKHLSEAGFLMKNPMTGNYRLGPRVLQLGLLARSTLGSEEIVGATLRSLHDLTSETVVFSVLDGLERVCVYVIEARSGLRNVVSVGDRYSLEQGASGHAILASLSSARAEEALARAALTQAELKAKRAALDACRREGVAISTGDRVAGATAVAAPVHVAGTVLGSITVTGPTDRMVPILDSASEGVVSAAKRLGEGLEGDPPQRVGLEVDQGTGVGRKER